MISHHKMMFYEIKTRIITIFSSLSASSLVPSPRRSVVSAVAYSSVNFPRDYGANMLEHEYALARAASFLSLRSVLSFRKLDFESYLRLSSLFSFSVSVLFFSGRGFVIFYLYLSSARSSFVYTFSYFIQWLGCASVPKNQPANEREKSAICSFNVSHVSHWCLCASEIRFELESEMLAVVTANGSAERGSSAVLFVSVNLFSSAAAHRDDLSIPLRGDFRN